MASINLQVNLQDEEGLELALNVLSNYLNSLRVKAAKKRFYCEDAAVVDDEDLPDPLELKEEDMPEEEKEEVDSAGVPWDPEKHSKNKTKLDNGRWRLKRKDSKSKEAKPVPPPPSEDDGLAKEEINYKGMMDILKGKGLTLPQMNDLARQVGEDSIGLVIAKPELIPAIIALAD
jgi:hypothetical protein